MIEASEFLESKKTLIERDLDNRNVNTTSTDIETMMKLVFMCHKRLFLQLRRLLIKANQSKNLFLKCL